MIRGIKTAKQKMFIKASPICVSCESFSWNKKADEPNCEQRKQIYIDLDKMKSCAFVRIKLKILVYENRKVGTAYWDISTPEKEKAGFLCLFRLLDDCWKCYSWVEGSPERIAELNKELTELQGVKVPAQLQKEYLEKKEAIEKQKQIEENLHHQYELLMRARAGDVSAARGLLEWRCGSEYERWEIEYPKNPLKEKNK